MDYKMESGQTERACYSNMATPDNYANIEIDKGELMGTDLSKVDLEALKQVDVRKVDPDTLVDIRGLKIDGNLPREQRMADFIRQVKNPYCFRVGKVVVSVGFVKNGVTFEEQMGRYLETL